jgi:pilus assembly protein CpaF
MDNLLNLYQASITHFFKPIKAFLEDDSVSEVMINGHEEIYIERGGKLELTDCRFDDAQALESALKNIAQFVGKRLIPENQSIEARLPDGSRVHIVQAPSARKGACVAIRKFSKHKLDVARLIEAGSLSEEAAEFLTIAVGLAKNIIVSGGTGSGKTTLLNVISSMILEGERIIVLEDSSELQLQQSHVVPFEVTPPGRNGLGGISMRELFRASLRMRPDRIIVGECRGGESLDMIQAMNSGHGGSMSTAHANTPRDALTRLEVMCLMGDVEIPLSALRAQVASAIDLVIQISRFHSGARKITHISEVLPLGDDGHYAVKDLFNLRVPEGGNIDQGVLTWTGNEPGFKTEPFLHGFRDTIKFTKDLWTDPASQGS